GQAVLVVPEHLLSLTCDEAVLRAIRGALLRDDVDDAARRLRPVQSGRRRTLENLDALDLVRIEVVEAGDHARPERLDRDAARLLVVDAHAVHVEERLAGEREGADAADADARTAANHAGAGQNRDA